MSYRCRAVLLAAVVSAMVASQAAAAALPQLIHHWKLDGTAVDSVGAANGSVNGASSWSNGKLADGFHTDGVNHGFVNAGNLPLTGSFAISFWVKPDDVTLDWRNMLSKHDVTNQRSFWIGQKDTNGHMRFGLYFDGQVESPLDTPVPVIASNQWAHVTAMWNEQTKEQSLFVNGDLAASANRGASDSFLNPRSSNLLFNTNHTNNSTVINVGSWARFGGTLDDVAIWDRPLTAGKIKAMNSAEALPALAGYNAGDYQALFDAYDRNFPQQIGNRRWKHATDLNLGEGNAAAEPNGFEIQMDSAGRGVSSLSVITLTGDPTNPLVEDTSIGSSTFPHQIYEGDVYVMLWLNDAVGGDDRAILRNEIDAVGGSTYDVLGSTDPLWPQLQLGHAGFDTLVRFNSAGVVGSFNWDFASHADVLVNRVDVVTTGAAVPEPASISLLSLAALALAARRRAK